MGFVVTSLILAVIFVVLFILGMGTGPGALRYFRQKFTSWSAGLWTGVRRRDQSPAGAGEPLEAQTRVLLTPGAPPAHGRRATPRSATASRRHS